MEKIKKFIVAALISCMLLVPMTATVSAADFFTKDNITAIFDTFGIDLSNPDSIRKALEELQNGGLSWIVSLLGMDLNDILAELNKYLFAFESETTPPETTEEPTTEEPTTEEPTTEAPTTAPPVYTPVYPSYEYTPPTYTPATTLPPETTTFEYIPPEQIYTEAYTTTVFQPIVEDNVSSVEDDTNPFKTVIGVILLLGSGIGVIVVVLALKRNRI